MTKPLVIYHGGGCPDGFASAWCAWRHFHDTAEYLPANYGEPPPDVTGRLVFMLDFSYKRPVILEMAGKAERIEIVDHHKTAEAELKDIELEAPNVSCLFDMKHSGAFLSWERFFAPEQVPWFIMYVEDRDLWSWKLPHSEEINTAMSCRPQDFETMDQLYNMTRGSYDSTGFRHELANAGSYILSYKKSLVERICRNAIEVDGIPTVNTSTLISEVAGELAKGKPYAAAWFIRADGKKQYSLRSDENGVDVSEIARQRGGGGHAHAAGYEEVVS